MAAITRDQAHNLVIQAIVQRGYYRLVNLETADWEEILMVVLSHTFSAVSTHEKSVKIQHQLESRITDNSGEMLPEELFTYLMEHDDLHKFVLRRLGAINKLLGSNGDSH